MRLKSIGLAYSCSYCTVFSLLYFRFEGKSTSPRASIWRGDLSEFFFVFVFFFFGVTSLGGLIFGGVYTWGPYFRNFTASNNPLN